MLQVDLQPLGHLLDALDDFGMVAVAVGDSRPLAHLDVAVLPLVHCRVVGRVSDVHHQRDIGVQRVRNLPRAEEADFLHRVGDDAHLRVELDSAGLEQAQRLSHSPSAYAVVERPRHDEVVAQKLELVVERDRVADADKFLGGLARVHADVDEQLVNLRHLGRAGVGAHEVRRDAADDPLHRAFEGVDDDALSPGDRRVGAAKPPHVHVAVVIDEVDRHADLVGVACEHQPRTATLVEHGDTVAVGVGIGLVSVLANVVHPDAQAA